MKLKIAPTTSAAEQKPRDPAAELITAMENFNAGSLQRTALTTEGREAVENLRQAARQYADDVTRRRDADDNIGAGDVVIAVNEFVTLNLGHETRDVSGVSVNVPAVESEAIRKDISRRGQAIVQRVQEIERHLIESSDARDRRDREEEAALLDLMKKNNICARLLDVLAELDQREKSYRLATEGPTTPARMPPAVCEFVRKAVYMIFLAEKFSAPTLERLIYLLSRIRTAARNAA